MQYKDSGIATVASGNGSDGWEISGFASWFDNLDAVGDIVRPGAYTRTLRERPSVQILWQHSSSEPIGKTLLLHEDKNGLFFKARLDPTRRGTDAKILTNSGTLKGVSIGYDPIDPKRRAGYRELNDIDLWEISLVTFPANSEAQLSQPGRMKDLLLISEVEAMQAKGWPVDDHKMVKCIAALRRESERLENGGQTAREVFYRYCYELQELKKLCQT